MMPQIGTSGSNLKPGIAENGAIVARLYPDVYQKVPPKDGRHNTNQLSLASLLRRPRSSILQHQFSSE